jgi:hypothetical protein
MIINGAMEVYQRTSSVTSVTDNTYPVQDRMNFFSSNDGVISVFASSEHPTGLGFSKSLKVDVTTADTSIAAAQYLAINQRIEGLNHRILEYGTVNARTITVSFYAKSNITGPFYYSVRNSAADRARPVEFNLSAANTWERIILTIPGDTSGTWLETTGIGATHQISLAMGSNYHGTNNTWQAGNKVVASNQVNLLSSTSNEFFLTGWQVELGSSASPYEHRTYVDTLNDCFRYFYRLRKTNAYGEFCTIRTYSSDDGTGIIYFPQPMRVQPTLTIDKTVNSTNFAYSLNSISVAASDVNVTQVGIAAASSSATAFVTGGGATIQSNGASGAIDVSFDFASEL